MKLWKIACAVLLAGCFAAGSAAAADETLKFRLITKQTGSSFKEVPNAEGVSLGAAEYVGVAVFEDGRIAFKDYVLTMENAGKTGSYTGYSTYTFENGDTLNLKFVGGWSPDRNGGDYDVLSGTGSFEGATGTGRFDAAKNPWKGASLWDGTITVTTAK